MNEVTLFKICSTLYTVQPLQYAYSTKTSTKNGIKIFEVPNRTLYVNYVATTTEKLTLALWAFTRRQDAVAVQYWQRCAQNPPLDSFTSKLLFNMSNYYIFRTNSNNYIIYLLYFSFISYFDSTQISFAVFCVIALWISLTWKRH